MPENADITVHVTACKQANAVYVRAHVGACSHKHVHLFSSSQKHAHAWTSSHMNTQPHPHAQTHSHMNMLTSSLIPAQDTLTYMNTLADSLVPWHGHTFSYTQRHPCALLFNHTQTCSHIHSSTERCSHLCFRCTNTLRHPHMYVWWVWVCSMITNHISNLHTYK